jgi:hypothetical protein
VQQAHEHSPTHEVALDVHAHLEYLPIPLGDDSWTAVELKLSALAEAVRQGESIAAITRYAASMAQGRDPMSTAVTDMSPLEYDAWSHYTTGNYPLPKIDWSSDCDLTPTSTKSQRIARRRAEALNRLYNTDKAGPGHSIWFTKNEIYHLPLVKAMARIIGAERNLLGGQYALNSSERADLQTINRILSVSSKVRKLSEDSSISAEISSAQRVLMVYRDKLWEKPTNNDIQRKRKRSPQ